MSESHEEPFIVFGAPDIRDEEISEVEAVLESGWLGTGPRVAQFESSFAEYKGVDPGRVAAVNSCTAALHVSMIAAGPHSTPSLPIAPSGPDNISRALLPRFKTNSTFT